MAREREEGNQITFCMGHFGPLNSLDKYDTLGQIKSYSTICETQQ